MKFLLAALMLMTVGSYAKIITAPLCYKGSMLTEDDIRDVELVFEPYVQSYPDGSSLYRVRFFKIGNQIFENSGSSLKQTPDILRFNNNDDFIPGGNAHYNIDIELIHNNKNKTFTGTFRHYQGATHGGFGIGGPYLMVDGTFLLQATAVGCHSKAPAGQAPSQPDDRR